MQAPHRRRNCAWIFSPCSLRTKPLPGGPSVARKLGERPDLAPNGLLRLGLAEQGRPNSDMLRAPRRFSHFVYGVIQSCLTCAIASAIASMPFLDAGAFVSHWVRSWLFAWLMMLPVVIFAAPAIRRLTDLLTRDQPAAEKRTA